jgi:hypothetical protein
MSEQPQPRICRLCDFPLIELDAYGERLCGCVACNNWQSLEPGEWHHLSDDDIIALKGMVKRWTEAAERHNH